MKRNIKEALEFLDGLEIVAMGGAEVLEDGKVSWSDLSVVIKMVKDLPILIDAVKGLSEVPAELADLDQAELVELGTKVYTLFTKVYEKVK